MNASLAALLAAAVGTGACGYEFAGDKCAAAGDDNATMETATSLGQIYPSQDVIRVERPVPTSEEEDWFSVDLQGGGDDFEASFTVQLETDPFDAGGDLEVVVSCSSGRMTTLRCDGILEESQDAAGTCTSTLDSVDVGYICERAPEGDPVFGERAFIHVSNFHASGCAGYALEIDLH